MNNPYCYGNFVEYIRFVFIYPSDGFLSIPSAFLSRYHLHKSLSRSSSSENSYFRASSSIRVYENQRRYQILYLRIFPFRVTSLRIFNTPFAFVSFKFKSNDATLDSIVRDLRDIWLVLGRNYCSLIPFSSRQRLLAPFTSLSRYGLAESFLHRCARKFFDEKEGFFQLALRVCLLNRKIMGRSQFTGYSVYEQLPHDVNSVLARCIRLNPHDAIVLKTVSRIKMTSSSRIKSTTARDYFLELVLVAIVVFSYISRAYFLRRGM